MTPTPNAPDTGRRYDDAEIEELLYQRAWNRDHHPSSYRTVGDMMEDIIRQLRAERDELRKRLGTGYVHDFVAHITKLEQENDHLRAALEMAKALSPWHDEDRSYSDNTQVVASGYLIATSDDEYFSSIGHE